MARDHEVVEHSKVDRFAGQREATGDLAIDRAGGRVAAWMVVGEDDAGAVVNQRVGDYLPERQTGAAIVAVMSGEVDAPRLIVDMGDPQMFAGRVGFSEAVGEEAPGRVETV